MKHLKYVFLLHLILLFYSCASICSKFAAKLPFLSIKWCALYALMIFILGVYAILWQQILKKLPLNMAYANKAITIVWGMIFGAFIFDEASDITAFKIVGAIIVLAGVILMVAGGKENTSKPDGKDGEDGE